MTTQGTSVRKWSRADFLDRAHELKRRLEVWQIDGAEPVYAPRDVASRMLAERQTFRDRVMAGEHNPDPDFEAWNLLEEGGAAKAIRRPKDPYSKTITVWEFRDFVEHLRSDAGDSDAAKLVGLKIERLLDAPMHKRARNEVFGDHIVGRTVDPSLTEQFLDAVKMLAPETREKVGNKRRPSSGKHKKNGDEKTLTKKQVAIVIRSIRLLANEDGYWNGERPSIRKIARLSKCAPDTVSRLLKKHFNDTDAIQNAVDKKSIESLIKKLRDLISDRE